MTQVFADRLKRRATRALGHPMHPVHRRMVHTFQLECADMRAGYERMEWETFAW